MGLQPYSRVFFSKYDEYQLLPRELSITRTRFRLVLALRLVTCSPNA